jgi:copper chaperone CopZ
MKQYKFHTNIKCSICEAKVSQLLSSEPGIVSFDLDLESKNRTLVVKAIEGISESDVISIVQVAGFKAKPVKRFWGLFN